MGELSKLLEQEETITHNGVTYKLSPLTLERQAEFEQWLENRAWESLERRRIRMPQHAFDAEAGRIFRDVAADMYGFFSDCARNAMAEPLGKGNRQLIYLRIKANHPDVTEGLVFEIVEKQGEELLRKIRTMDHDPNSQAPQAGAGDQAPKAS